MLSLRLNKCQHIIGDFSWNKPEHTKTPAIAIETTSLRQAEKSRTKCQIKLLQLNPRSKEAPELNSVVNMPRHPLTTSFRTSMADASRQNSLQPWKCGLKPPDVRPTAAPQARRTQKQKQLKLEGRNLKDDQTIPLPSTDEGSATVIMDRAQ